MSTLPFIEGRGMLWRHDNPVVAVDYHLTIPLETPYTLNPLDNLRLTSPDPAGGFILLRPQDEIKINLTDYILQTAQHGKKTIWIEQRYKKTTHHGQERVAFWAVML